MFRNSRYLYDMIIYFYESLNFLKSNILAIYIYISVIDFHRSNLRRLGIITIERVT